MELARVFTDDRAVSPVIGVILMVAVTVILAAVIGTFVLGIGSQVTSETPSASVQIVFDDGDTMTITHRGGDAVPNESIKVTLAGSEVTTDAGTSYDLGNDDAFTSGDTIEYDESAAASPNFDSSATGRLIWSPPNDDGSVILAEDSPT